MPVEVIVIIWGLLFCYLLEITNSNHFNQFSFSISDWNDKRLQIILLQDNIKWLNFWILLNILISSLLCLRNHSMKYCAAFFYFMQIIFKFILVTFYYLCCFDLIINLLIYIYIYINISSSINVSLNWGITIIHQLFFYSCKSWLFMCD